MTNVAAFPAAEVAALADLLRAHVGDLTGHPEDSPEEVKLALIADALVEFDTVKDETDDTRRWPAAHMLHDAAVALADHWEEHFQYATYRAALVAAIEAFDAARDGVKD